MGQIAKEMEKLKSGSLSANTQTNPKDQCNPITTRRGTLVGDLSREKNEQEVAVEEIIEDEMSKFEEETKKNGSEKKSEDSKKMRVRKNMCYHGRS